MVENDSRLARLCGMNTMDDDYAKFFQRNMTSEEDSSIHFFLMKRFETFAVDVNVVRGALIRLEPTLVEKLNGGSLVTADTSGI